MENQIAVKDRLDKISKSINGIYSPDQITIIKNTVAKGTNDNELAFFLNLSHSLGLNPFNKEIWCYKDHKGNLISFAGRDGFLSIGQKDARWNGMYSCEVREGEKYEQVFDSGNVSIKHVKGTEKNHIIGAYCYIKPKGCETATIEYVDFNTYNKNQFIWKSHPADMIKKVAEIKALKKAFGIAGLYDENDFAVQNEKVIPIDTESQFEANTYVHIEGLLSNCTLDEDQKCSIEKELENGIYSSRADELIYMLKENQIPAIDRGNMSAKEINQQIDLKE